MKHILKSVALASVTFLLLSFVGVGLNTETILPTPPNQTMTQLFVLLALAPYGVSGYVGGRLAQRHGLFVGLLSNIVGLSLFAIVFWRAILDSDPSMYILGILIGWLAGGVGELHAVKSKNG